MEMFNLEKNPMKLYIQDIFRAKQNPENKYCYELFDHSFKNIMIHGVVTFLVNNNGKINFEISDPTGCIEVYYDNNKNGTNISDVNFKHLVRSFANVSCGMDENVITMSSLLNSIEDKYKIPLSFQEGSFLSVIGDVFVEDVKNLRMVSAYSCKESCATNDILWLEELRYLYDKYYIKE